MPADLAQGSKTCWPLVVAPGTQLGCLSHGSPLSPQPRSCDLPQDSAASPPPVVAAIPAAVAAAGGLMLPLRVGSCVPGSCLRRLLPWGRRLLCVGTPQCSSWSLTLRAGRPSLSSCCLVCQQHLWAQTSARSAQSHCGREAYMMLQASRRGRELLQVSDPDRARKHSCHISNATELSWPAA